MDPINDIDTGWPHRECVPCDTVWKYAPVFVCSKCHLPTTLVPVRCECIPTCDGVSISNYQNNKCRCDLARSARRAYDTAHRNR